MKKFFTLFAMVCLSALSALAATPATVTEVTDIQAAIDNGTKLTICIGDKYLYGSTAQNTAMGTADEAVSESNVVNGYKIISGEDGNVLFRCITPANTEYNCWNWGTSHLNAQPSATGVTFNLSLNNQNGQDLPNGAVWTIINEGGQTYLKNVGNGAYFAGANTSATPVAVKFVTIKPGEADPEPKLTIPANLQTLIDNKTIVALKSGNDCIYGTAQQGVAVGSWAAAMGSDNTIGYVLEADEYHYYLRAVLGDGSDVSAWGTSPCYLNTQPAVGSMIFKMKKEGQDIKNGGSWLLEEVATGKYSIQNVANKGYLSVKANGVEASTTAEVANTWELVVLENTIPADMYSVTATVTMAEGISEAAVPAEFKKYIGTYKTFAAIDGETTLAIKENKEGGLFNDFEIQADRVIVNDSKKITLNGKDFTVRAADEAAGVLAITADGDDYKMDDAVIFYNGKKIATVSNITMAKAEEKVDVMVTYVDADQPTTALYDAEATVWRAGYNKIADGEVTMPYFDWHENKITYVGVDAFTMKGVIKTATLKMEVSGSSDSRRTTDWGVGYNTTPWSADMTYDTADKTITLLGGTQNQPNKSSSNFKELTFDVTEAFATSKIATLIIYETAAAGGYVRNITVEVEMAGTPLEAAKDKALKKVEGVTVGEGVFMYKQDDIDAYKAAVEAAETIEEVEAISVPEATMPDPDQKYQFANVTAEGMYLGQAKLSADPVPVKFEAVAGGYYLNIDGKYLNMVGNNTWSMEATETAKTVWTVSLADGKYTIKGPNGIVGTDNVGEGSATYGNKATSNNGFWIISDYDDPTAVVVAKDAIKPTKKVAKFAKKGEIIIVSEDKAYTVAGAAVK